MFKFLFAAILLLHGLIHLMGFAKAFQLAELKDMATPVSKPLGLAWLLATILLVVGFMLWIFKSPHWAWVCLTGIALSQVLVLLFWREAKWGTVANILLLLVVLPAWASGRFAAMVQREEQALTETVNSPTTAPIAENDLAALPPIVAQWLRYSGVVGKPALRHVLLTQSGKMRLKPGGNWMDFNARQHFNTMAPAFVWSTRVRMMPGVFFDGRDKFENGKGQMRIKLLGVVDLVNEKDDPRLNSGTALRLLGEMCWFPSSALQPYVQWEAIDSLKAKATFSYGDDAVEGIFTFSPDGEMVSYEAIRFYGSGPDAIERPWQVRCTRSEEFGGYRIPKRMSVMWKLPEGDFTWLEMEIGSWQGN
ncbi:MAG TPA: DUF6544 family protein [Phnomibacter sp.]|nr:DUF6544 family protein [Phnomibacter sp.]